MMASVPPAHHARHDELQEDAVPGALLYALSYTILPVP